MATTLAVGSPVKAQAQVPNVRPHISRTNGDRLHNSPIGENQLPGSAQTLHRDGYLDEVLVGLGIAEILAAIIGTAVTNQVNLPQGLNGQFVDKLPF
ncbi:hypothetical protein CPHO_06790 [Corynebacterium phocae]|uniref:Uncharacterized protein n=1 Tax=Corynebacterium phocae TaxID=161895 RepID=A0A1L7D3F0_9CORY|nr:hypothetical protein CPHO_06790 [Corynebacterium phocae]